MLLKAHITDIPMHSERWHQGRLAKLTASEWFNFMQEKPFTTGAMSYLYRKLGEELSGIPAKDEIQTAATLHGQEYEDENLRLFGQKMGVEFLVTQKLICAPGSRFSCTPDGLIVRRESSDGLSYEVETVEAKAPYSYDGYIKLALCKTALDVKKVNPNYFHQVLKQMDLCGALKGYLSVYHPLFRVGGFKIIEFRKIDLVEDFKLLKTRQQMAIDKFNELRETLFNLN